MTIFLDERLIRINFFRYFPTGMSKTERKNITHAQFVQKRIKLKLNVVFFFTENLSKQM